MQQKGLATTTFLQLLLEIRQAELKGSSAFLTAELPFFVQSLSAVTAVIQSIDKCR